MIQIYSAIGEVKMHVPWDFPPSKLQKQEVICWVIPGCCYYSSCMADVIIYRSAVLLHRVRHLMVFVASPFGGKEAVLTHIKVETLEAAVAETTDW